MYESLTKYLSDVASDKSSEWTIKGPYISYGLKIKDLEQAIYDFVNAHEEFGLNRYYEILAKHGIDWGTQSMSSANVAGFDGRAVMSLLVGAVRAERFSDGAILEFLENGSFEKWLRRLAEIDNGNQ